MRHVTRALPLLGLALVAWLSVVLIGKSSALTAAKVTIAEQKEENAAIVEASYREKRALIVKNAREVAEARAAERKARARLDATLDSANTATAGSIAVLQDSAATVPQLRGALYVQVATTERVVAEFHAYLMSDSTYHVAEAEERAALYKTLTLADSTIRVKNEALRLWKNAARPKPWYQRIAKTLCIGGVAAGGGAGGASIGDAKGAAIGALSGVLVGAISCR